MLHPLSLYYVFQWGWRGDASKMTVSPTVSCGWISALRLPNWVIYQRLLAPSRPDRTSRGSALGTCAKRAGTSPVSARRLWKGSPIFSPATENGPSFCECFVRTQRSAGPLRVLTGAGVPTGLDQEASREGGGEDGAAALEWKTEPVEYTAANPEGGSARCC